VIALKELRCGECGRLSAPEDYRSWRAFHREDERAGTHLHICCPACTRDWSRPPSRDEGGLYWPWDLPF